MCQTMLPIDFTETIIHSRERENLPDCRVEGIIHGRSRRLGIRHQKSDTSLESSFECSEFYWQARRDESPSSRGGSLSLCSDITSDDESSEDSDFVFTSEPRLPFSRLYAVLFCLLIILVRRYGSASELIQHWRGINSFIMPIERERPVDAIVLIALGPAGTSPMLGWSVDSLFRVGGWTGNVYVITDNEKSVRQMIMPADRVSGAVYPARDNIHIIKLQERKENVPSESHNLNAKLTKCSLLHILPRRLQHVLYIDADIIIGKSLEGFLENIAQVWKTPMQQTSPLSMGLFQDCKSFRAGYSIDCDTWNTGVMSLLRGNSDQCMDAWCERLALQGGTDQAALDDVIADGKECQNIHELDVRYVRMMKDFFTVTGFVKKKLFNHFTGIFRPQNLHAMHFRFYERMLGRSLRKLLPPKEKKRIVSSR